MGKAEDDKLQRYFDGELDAEERARFEASMTDDDRERLAALAEMRVLLSGTLEAESAEVDIWSGVQAQLAKEKASAPTPIVRTPAVLRPLRRRRMVAGTTAGVMFAAAAAFLFVLRPWHAPITNGCDIESLEVEGAVATVMTQADAPNGGDTTIIWTTEEE